MSEPQHIGDSFGVLRDLVRVTKTCRECRTVFEGWTFGGQPKPNETVMGICDPCVDEKLKERARVLELERERSKRQKDTAPTPASAVKFGREVLQDGDY